MKFRVLFNFFKVISLQEFLILFNLFKVLFNFICIVYTNSGYCLQKKNYCLQLGRYSLTVKSIGKINFLYCLTCFPLLFTEKKVLFTVGKVL